MKKCEPWMFIRWISYLLAQLSDSWMAERVLPALTSMAKSYPVAMYFPFNVSSDVKFLNPESQRLVKPLKKMLHAPILESFMYHLALLQHPEHRFGDWVAELRRMAKKRSSDFVVHDWKQFCKLTLSADRREYGSYNSKFASDWSSKILKVVGGEQGKNLDRYDKLINDLNSLASKAKEAMPNKNVTRSEKMSLYSNWLSDYDYSQLSVEERVFMEVPGQYSGYGKPDPETHIRISSFEDDILSMGSLRKPKKIVIVGTNQKRFSFLVKGGEDLRQDQRVEELWRLMNELLASNPSTSSIGLQITTYQVLPLSLQLGLVEWMEGTNSLKGIMEDELVKIDPSMKHLHQLQGQREHNQWMENFASATSKSHATNYHKMILQATRTASLQKWERQKQVTNQELLRNAIHNIALSPESYLSLRNGFARSLACLSIAGYVAGIGDRHLDNLLLDFNTGKLVGIDFGHAFGSATFQLAIPELVPFRLTPQLVHFLDPIGTDGLLLHNMSHVLSCFSENKTRLLYLMEIFLKEPHMEWIKFSEKNAERRMDSGEVVKHFAKSRIKLVKDKLSQRNPAYITCDELNESVLATQNKAPLINKLKEITKGLPQYNFRANCGERCDSVRDQVECLIDQATDPNILSRFWSGWNSFL